MAKNPSAAISVKAFPFGSAGQLARAIKSGAVSSGELLEAYLERVDRLNGAINAVVVDDRETARKAAKAADRARPRVSAASSSAATSAGASEILRLTTASMGINQPLASCPSAAKQPAPTWWRRETSRWSARSHGRPTIWRWR